MSITRVRLDSVCDVIMGQAPSGEAYNLEGKGWPLIAGAGDFGAVHPAPKKFTTEASKLSKPGDIILGIRATIGEKVLSDGEYCLGRGVAALRANPKLESRFLWHWLDHTRPILSAKAKGATFKQVNRQDIKELEITLPPIAEQRRIAAILDKAEELRELRRQALRELDAIAQSTFIEMFGDPIINPKRWIKVKLENVTINITDGKHGDCRPKLNSGYYFLSAKDIVDGKMEYKNARQIEYADFEEVHKRTKLEEGDVLITNSGTIGRTAVAVRHVNLTKTTFQKSVAIIKIEKEKIDSVFLKFILDASVAKLSQASSGSSQKNLLLSQLRSFRIYLPPLSLQQEFARRIESIEQLKTTHRESLDQLDSLFVSLQHRAFRGEL